MPPSSQDAALRKMLKLVNSLLARSDSTPFAEPVDWRGLELWDYPKIIKKMMDLGTVKRKLERKSYKTHEECAEDLRLIWSNCKLYNEQDSDFWHLANVFSKKFEDRYKKIQAECAYDVCCCCVLWQSIENTQGNRNHQCCTHTRVFTPFFLSVLFLFQTEILC